MPPMKVRLLFFAVLRDIAGVDARELVLAEGTTARDVWQSLRSEFAKLADYVQPPMIAVNETYAEPETVLREGDELAFIPPVAGG
jgi:molybdopterin converting factor subunit 1